MIELAGAIPSACRASLSKIDHAFRLAPAITCRLGRRETVAVAAGVAIASDVVEDQINASAHLRDAILPIDIEPAHFAPCNCLIKTLEHGVMDGTGQARGPVLFPKLFGFRRSSAQP
jgi:hypothetical protein